MSTVNLNPKEIPEDVARLPIQLIKVTVHTLGYVFDNDERSGNHAGIYIITGGTSSVQPNMVKDGPTAVMGTYKVVRCEYETSNTALQNFDMKAQSWLDSGRRHRPHHPLGTPQVQVGSQRIGLPLLGTIVKDFEVGGYVDVSSKPSPGDVMGYPEYNYHKEENLEFTEIAQGTFIN